MSKETVEGNIAVIRIRGMTGIRQDIANTLTRLKLDKKNTCVILKDTPDILGMVKKCKDYITWGTIDEETKTELIEKRAQKDKEGKTKNAFRLNSPVGGFEKKGIKKPFVSGGVLGNRKELISILVKKML